MVLFNHATREMTAKIVYYGPGLCGKTTNLMVIFDKLDPKSKGKMLSLATKTDRTLFFDLLPVDIGKVGPFSLKIQLYTVPGQVFYNETRKLVLKGADSIVFVADSQPAMIEANRESFSNLLDNLEENQIDPNDTPIIIQYNKRDIPGVLPVADLQEALGFADYPSTEAAAVKGHGVMETFKLASKITAKHLLARLQGRSEAPLRKVSLKRSDRKEADPAEAMLKSEPVAEAPSPFSESIPSSDAAPFAESMPFPDAGSIDSDYDKAEEVSLEQLLAEGRDRPATFSGNVPLPEADEVEELGAESLVEAPVAVALVEEPAPVETLFPSDGIEHLENEILSLRDRLQEREALLLDTLRELDRIRERVASALPKEFVP